MGLHSEQAVLQLANYLRNKSLLLVLDNFEHLMADAKLISALVCQVPEVKILVTSREPLNLQEEWVFPIKGLAIPDESQLQMPTTCSAVQLFVERAQQIDPVFSLTENAYAVNQICRYLDGMPLGIELAVGLLRAIPASDIAEQMDRSLDTLESALRNLPDRHRSLRTVFEHTWELLSDVEQTALMRLSVFRGGFQREAAVYVTETRFRVLLSLVNKSLVRLHPSGRYDLHELMRQFAEEKLRAVPGAWDVACNNHLEYFLSLVEGLEPLLSRSEQAAAFDHLEMENANLRTALAWAHAKPDGVSQELRLATALREFWFFYGHMEEGFQYLASALERQDRAAPDLRVGALYTHCMIAWRLGYDEHARLSANRALDIYRSHEDRRGLLWGIIGAGLVDPDPARGIALLMEGLQIARETPDQAVTVQLTVWLGTRISRLVREGSCVGTQMVAETLCFVEEALAICRASGNRLTASKLYEQMSGIWLGLGEYARADAATDARIAMLGGFLKHLPELALSIMMKGIFAWAQGDYVKAKTFYEDAYRRLEQGSPDVRLSACLFNLARVELDLGNCERSWRLFDQMLHWAEERPFRGGEVFVAFTLTGLACLASVTGQPEQAARLAGAADAHLEHHQRQLDPPDYLAYQRDLAIARCQLGEQVFAALYREGRQMPFGEAVAYAHHFKPKRPG